MAQEKYLKITPKIFKKEEKKASLDFFEEFPSQKYIDIPSFTNSADPIFFCKVQNRKPIQICSYVFPQKVELFR